MGLETATYISQLDVTNPLGSDQKSQGDDHLRLIKSTIKNTFPNFGAAALSASNTQIDKVVTTISINTGSPSGSVSIDASGYVSVTNRLGVGTTSPAYPVDVSVTGGTNVITNNVRLFANASANSSSRLLFGAASNPTNSAVRGYAASATGGVLMLETANDSDGVLAVRLQMDGSGNAGYNVAPPNYGASINSFAMAAPAQPIYDLYVGTTRTASFTTTNAATTIGSVTSLPVNFITAGSTRMSITSGGVITYGSNEIGFRDVPQQSVVSGSRTIGTADRGYAIPLGVGASVTAPANTLPNGSVVTLVNASGGNLTINQGSGLTLFLAGTNTSGNRTMSANSVATIYFYSQTVAFMSGAGVS